MTELVIEITKMLIFSLYAQNLTLVINLHNTKSIINTNIISN